MAYCKSTNRIAVNWFSILVSACSVGSAFREKVFIFVIFYFLSRRRSVWTGNKARRKISWFPNVGIDLWPHEKSSPSRWVHRTFQRARFLAIRHQLASTAEQTGRSIRTLQTQSVRFDTIFERSSQFGMGASDFQRQPIESGPHSIVDRPERNGICVSKENDAVAGKIGQFGHRRASRRSNWIDKPWTCGDRLSIANTNSFAHRIRLWHRESKSPQTWGNY